MTPAAKILKMIETVDPEDAEALDEIDARVFCWEDRKNYEDVVFIQKQYDLPNESGLVAIDDWSFDEPIRVVVPGYTRSRDALKAIRPEGWCFRLINSGNTEWLCMYAQYLEPNKCAKWCPTEELAELHAIIQAIEYERGDG